MRNVFIVRQNSDQTEGRGVMLPLCAFFERADAEEYKGSNRLDMRDILVMKAYDSLDEAINENEKMARAKALAKLSHKERKLLGLE